ncbi:hypothetical protein CF327_g3688 [Tilletia walkeri]|uniref:CCAAT-binding factor domain-containing protein n=1 Tax=Tilletia walkeri TaxID=117179 RepID=A0A8X7NAT8_9BASI|nr:hypothetical protein CF327_g3688 [Tilletia walkeri]KAE8269618.1 hypothetical protein A4X09_0g2710 [Tilletia walkeri]
MSKDNSTKTKQSKGKSKGKVAEDDALSRVQSLQHALASSTDLNPLTDLIDLARSLAAAANSHNDSTIKALDRALLVLGQALASLIAPPTSSKKEQRRVLLYPDQVDPEGNLTSASLPRSLASQLSPAELQVSEWVKTQWNDAVHLLCALTAYSDEGVRSTALRQLFALQLAASSALSSHSAAGSTDEDADAQGSARWAPSPWRATVLALTAGPPTSLSPSSSSTTPGLQRKSHIHPDLHGTFLDELAEKYDDARYAFLRELRSILSNPPPSATNSHDALRSNSLQLLMFLTAIPTQEDHLNAFFVPALAKSRSGKKNKKAVKTNGKAKGKEVDGSDDEDVAPQPGQEGFADDMQDWFSDSDEDRPGSSSKARQGQTSSSSTSGLGKLARDQRAKRKRKSTLPLSEAIHVLSAQKGVFANAWLALMLPRSVPVSKTITKPLGGPLTVAQTHQILLVLHSQILPHFTRPNLVHEFLVDCLNAGPTNPIELGDEGSMEVVSDASGANAATALLALHGLYTLILQHNLDYPDFFKRLYTLLLYTPHLLHMRYRSRFLRLLETFLSSTLLPAALVASFAKRLSRMSLRASPAAAVCVVPLVWNLLKRHKNCLALIHREFGGDRLAAGPAGLPDPFDALESDPLKTRALESSLWELAALGAYQAALQRQGSSSIPAGGSAHYHHATSTLSRILAEPFLKERYDLDDFLDVTYSTLFENESSRIVPREEKEGGVERKRKAIVAPAVRSSLGDVLLERYERERAVIKEREKRMREEEDGEKEGEEAVEEGANGEKEEATTGTGPVSAPVVPPTSGLGFRGFSTAKVRAKRRKLASGGDEEEEVGSAQKEEEEDVMDLWLF